MSHVHDHEAGHRCPACVPRASLRPIGRRAFARGLLASAGLVALAACTESPTTGRSTFGSIDDDVSAGRREHPNVLQAFGGEYTEGGVPAYVNQIGAKLAQHSEFQNINYKWTVLNTPIVNALALPGGYIYVTRGLMALASNEAELAGVMGHEMGHVTARHSAERQTQSIIAQLGLLALGIATGSNELVNLAAVGAQAYLQSYSRDQEFEADTLGVRYMAEGGWDPSAMATFLASLREYSQLEAQLAGRDPGTVDEFNMMASHPRTLDRVQAATEAAGVQHVEGVLNRDVYLQAIEGLRYGDDPAQGVVDGQWFRHPGLGFEFKVPEGFSVVNGESQVSAQNASGAALVFDMDRATAADPAEYLTSQWGEGVQFNDLERISVNGLQGATGWTRLQTNAGPADVRAVAIKGEGNQVFRFLFLAPVGNSSFNSAFQETVYSFRRLSAAEAAQIKGFRIYVLPAGPSDSVASLSRGMPFGAYNEQAFRVLNDLVGGGGLAQGELVKIVRAG
ncbi:MAG TPA: M48 family metalloprotease [Kiloniellales bacterium]|nr:M48 family metalloprotease [Kiloniellales bacterium]